MKIKKGDTVAIIKGKDRGKTGKVLRVFGRENKVFVEGVNMKKRHTRPRKAGQKGEIITISHPLALANMMLVCNHCGKKTRVGYRVSGAQKMRICKKCEREL